MDRDVNVVVVSDPEKSTSGVIQDDRPLDQILVEIAGALKLGSASDWDIALIPASLTSSLAEYKPSDGDTLLLLQKAQSRGPAFRVK